LVTIHPFAGLANVFPWLTRNRQQIAVELQGHGRTADIDRPLSFEQEAEDVITLLKHLQIDRADFFGESIRGITPVLIAIRHPELTKNAAGKFMRELEATVPMKRFGQPAEVAAAIAFLASQDAPTSRAWNPTYTGGRGKFESLRGNHLRIELESWLDECESPAPVYLERKMYAAVPIKRL